MINLTSQYIPAMNALNDFYVMLFDALIQAMPEATFSTTGAYVWRGFRVDSFRNLSINQYYCVIDPERPKNLVFKESFKYKGKYREFNMVVVDLLEENFFKKNCEEQHQFLKDFVTKAAEASLDWQASKSRLEKVPLEFQNGKGIFRHKFRERYTIQQVTEDFIYAFPAQNKIFYLLIPCIEKVCMAALSKKVDLIPNAHWCNWDFRGYRMKFINASGEIPKGPSDYVWRIYFKEPLKLTCERYKGRDYPRIPPFILDQDFLSSSQQEQIEHLYQFSLQSLQTN